MLVADYSLTVCVNTAAIEVVISSSDVTLTIRTTLPAPDTAVLAAC
jgi:hypothetical protein